MIVHIVGARPQFIKLLPLHQALAERGAPQRILHTGQHWESGMSEVFFQEFGLHPDHILAWNPSHDVNTEAIMTWLKEWTPSTVVVYGDTFSTWCAARASKRLGLPLAHVEAGLRSFNAAMPEEEARVKTDILSDWHFAPSERALVQLQREGLDRGHEHTVMTGDIMADAWMQRNPGSYESGRILVTLHRNTNVDDSDVRTRIVSALEALAQTHEVHWPIHPRLRAHLEQTEMPKNIHWHPPLGREAILAQLEAAEWVITDSGGVQKEAYYSQRNCIVLRNETEWVELLETGHSFLVNPEAMEDAGALSLMLRQVLQTQTPAEFPPIYGQGDAAHKMAASLWQEGPVGPNVLQLKGDAQNPQMVFAAEVLRRVTGIGVHFSQTGADWNPCSYWDAPFLSWDPQDLGDDLWAKAAYLASRAEEFQAERVDEHGRFDPEASSQWSDLQRHPEIPMGHVWLEAFVQRFRPKFRLADRRSPAPTVVVDIDHRYALRGFSWSHRVAALLRAVVIGPWRLVTSHLKGVDPFDASAYFERWMAETSQVRWQFFAWIGPIRGPQDKGPSIDQPRVAKAHANWAKRYPSTGVHPTYAHHDNGPNALMGEVLAWNRATQRVLQRSRYHYLRMTLPTSQRQLHAAGMTEDWSMEYAKQPGYRAGVAVPIPAWGVGPQGAALDEDGIPYLTYVPVAFMDQNAFELSRDEVSAWLIRWEESSRRYGASLVLATHWRFFGPGADLFPETAKYRAWREGLHDFLMHGA